jgi:hypothetical protein
MGKDAPYAVTVYVAAGGLASRRIVRRRVRSEKNMKMWQDAAACVRLFLFVVRGGSATLRTLYDRPNQGEM